MSSNKQSSVELLVEQLFPNNDSERVFGCSKELLEQAKALHKKEIIEAYASGSNDRIRNTINTNYYKETYKEVTNEPI